MLVTSAGHEWNIRYANNAIFVRKFYILGTNVICIYQKQHKRLNKRILEYLQQNSMFVLSPETPKPEVRHVLPDGACAYQHMKVLVRA